MVRLPAKWGEYLEHQPENGMGYQRVDVRLASGRLVEDVLAFNAEKVELPDDCGDAEIRELWLHFKTAPDSE